MISPSEIPDSWNKLVVAGRPSPGVVTLSGHKRPVGWATTSPRGKDGGTSTRTGGPIVQFDAEFYLVDSLPNGQSDFDEWDDFQALLESSITGDKPKALEIVHPDLWRNFITAIVLREMGEMRLNGRGGARIKVGLLVHRPPKPKPARAPQHTVAEETDGDRKIREGFAELDRVKAEGAAL